MPRLSDLKGCWACCGLKTEYWGPVVQVLVAVMAGMRSRERC